MMTEAVIGRLNQAGIALKIRNERFLAVGNFQDIRESLCQIGTTMRSC